MKKILYFIFLFTINSLIVAQIPTKTEDIVELICSGKWYLESVEVDGQKVPLPEDNLKGTWVMFNKNGTIEESDMGTKGTGKWTYIPEKKILRSDDKDGIVDQILLKITSTQLSFSVKDNSGLIMIIHMKK